MAITPQNLYDSAIAQFTDSTSTPFNSTSSLRSYLWEAFYILVTKLGCNVTSDTSTTTVSGTTSYSIPTGFIRIQRIEYDGVKLKKISERKYDALANITYGGSATTGNPEFYFIRASTIYLYPTPDAAKTLTIIGPGDPTKLDDTNDDTTITEIPNSALHGTIDYMLYRMYLKEDNKKADVHMNLWFNSLKEAQAQWQEYMGEDNIETVQDEENYLTTDFGLI